MSSAGKPMSQSTISMWLQSFLLKIEIRDQVISRHRDVRIVDLRKGKADLAAAVEQQWNMLWTKALLNCEP